MKIESQPPEGYDAESAQHDEVWLSGTKLPEVKFEPCVGHFIFQLVIDPSSSGAGQHTCVEQKLEVCSRQEAQAALDAYLKQPINWLLDAEHDKRLLDSDATKALIDQGIISLEPVDGSLNLPVQLRYLGDDNPIDRYFLGGPPPETVLNMDDRHRLVKCDLYKPKAA